MSEPRMITARYEILRGGGTLCEIYPSEAPTVDCISTSALKMSIKGTFYSDNFSRISMLTDRLRAVLIINGIEYDFGRYIITTANREHADGISVYEIEAYSVLYLASRSKIETRLHLSAGTNYITAISGLLIDSGITSIEAAGTSLTLATDREDWEIGTDRLTIINALLDEINYNSAYVGMSGEVKLTPYIAPSLSNIAHTYSVGFHSLISSEFKAESDYFSKCSVFKVICSNADLASPMTATAENNDASSPFCIANMGRVLYVENVDNTPSQTALQARADNLLMKSYQTTETVEFYTAVSAEHGTFETIAIDNGELCGIFAETEWSVTMSPDNDMKHKAKRVIT